MARLLRFWKGYPRSCAEHAPSPVRMHTTLIDAEPAPVAIERERVALLIIDMQRDFLEPGGFGESLGNDVGLLRAAIAPTGRLLDAARAAGLMVIHTRE